MATKPLKRVRMLLGHDQLAQHEKVNLPEALADDLISRGIAEHLTIKEEHATKATGPGSNKATGPDSNKAPDGNFTTTGAVPPSIPGPLAGEQLNAPPVITEGKRKR